MKKENGITIIVLIITIILMLILAGVGIHYGTGAINKAKLEDIKTDMISIKTKAKIIADEYNFEEDVEDKKGTEVTDESILNKFGVSENLYKMDRESLNQQGLNSIQEDVYYVKYDFENPVNTEVYYINGIDGKYSLTEIQN